MKEDKLTPLYVICVKKSWGQELYGDNRSYKYLKKPDKFGISVMVKGGPKTFTDQELAIIKAKKIFESDGTPVKVYHYGFKERGFRVSDINLGTVFEIE